MTFGDIPGVPVGAWFDSKQALSDAGVHRQIMGGMWGGQDGVKSIVLNEGYVDDEDLGDTILYTGHGGQDGEGRQVADQEWTRANAGMRVNRHQATPVRVVRGHKLRSTYAPPSGYRYDGLYLVERCWQEPSKHGPLICRFALQEMSPGRTAQTYEAEPAATYTSQPTARASSRQVARRELPELTDEQREHVRLRLEERRRNR